MNAYSPCNGGGPMYGPVQFMSETSLIAQEVEGDNRRAMENRRICTTATSIAALACMNEVRVLDPVNSR